MKTSPQLETSPVKELVRAGHEFAAALGADTPLIEIAKLVSRLATELDVQLSRANTLASLSTEPVAFINGAREPVLYGEHIGIAIATQLYAAAPAPVVPEDIPDSVYEILCQACGGGEKACDFAEDIWDACRKAIAVSNRLQGKTI